MAMAMAAAVHASMRKDSSPLNPHAPLFVPASYLAAEDFSPEWWCLVHTCPSFRAYWLQDYSLTDPDQCLSQMRNKGQDSGFDHGFAEVELEMEWAMERNKLHFSLRNTSSLGLGGAEKIEDMEDLSHLKPKKLTTKKKKNAGGDRGFPSSLPSKEVLQVRPRKKSEALHSKMIHQPRR